MKLRKLRIRLDSQDVNTIVAALTYYLESGQGEPSQRTDEIHNLATGDYPGLFEDISMDDEGIESLIARFTE